MKVKDIITLMKAGYTPAEIGNLGDTAQEVIEFAQGGVSKEDIPILLQLVKDDTEAPAASEEKTPETEDNTDYKSLYLSAQKEIQSLNNRKDLSGGIPEKSADEMVADIVRDFM